MFVVNVSYVNQENHLQINQCCMVHWRHVTDVVSTKVLLTLDTQNSQLIFQKRWQQDSSTQSELKPLLYKASNVILPRAA